MYLIGSLLISQRTHLPCSNSLLTFGVSAPHDFLRESPDSLCLCTLHSKTPCPLGQSHGSLSISHFLFLGVSVLYYQKLGAQKNVFHIFLSLLIEVREEINNLSLYLDWKKSETPLLPPVSLNLPNTSLTSIPFQSQEHIQITSIRCM